MYRLSSLTRAPRICVFCSYSSARFYASKVPRAAPKPKPRKKIVKPTNELLKPELTASLASEENSVETKPHKSRIEAFLEDLDASSKLPTLQDLYDMKPPHPVGPSSTNYEQEHNLAVKRVMNAFQKPQIMHLINALKVEGKIPMQNRRLVQILLDKSWGWPSPDIVRKAARDNADVVTQEIGLSPGLMLSLLSEDMHSFQKLAQEHKVRLSLDLGRRCAIVEGLRPNISILEKYLGHYEEEMITESLTLPGSVAPSPLEIRLISRQTGVYIEPSDKRNEVKLTASSQTVLDKAKRTLQRYLNHTTHKNGVPIIVECPFPDPEQDHLGLTAALYPFMPSKSSPWYLSEQRLFRLRMVWEVTQEDSRVLGDIGSPIAFDGQSADLTQRLPLLMRPHREGFVRSWEASFGHVLFSAGNTEIRPPVQGKHAILDILPKVKERNLSSSFIPSLPYPMMSSPPTSVTTIHRALYRRVNTESALLNRHETNAVPSEVFLLEVAMQHIANAPDLDDLDAQDAPLESISLHPVGGATRCRVGLEESIDIMIPDKPMDMRLTVRDMQDVAEDAEPEALRDYLDQLLQFLNFSIDQQPSAPEILVHNNVTYVLDTSSSVRRTEEQLSFTDVAPWEQQEATIGVISETDLDLESKEKASSCIVQTAECNTQMDWDLFMSRCTTITSIPYSPASQTNETDRAPYFSELDS